MCARVIKRKRTLGDYVVCVCVRVHVWYCSLCVCYSCKRNVIGMQIVQCTMDNNSLLLEIGNDF